MGADGAKGADVVGKVSPPTSPLLLASLRTGFPRELTQGGDRAAGAGSPGGLGACRGEGSARGSVPTLTQWLCV